MRFRLIGWVLACALLAPVDHASAEPFATRRRAAFAPLNVDARAALVLTVAYGMMMVWPSQGSIVYSGSSSGVYTPTRNSVFQFAPGSWTFTVTRKMVVSVDASAGGGGGGGQKNQNISSSGGAVSGSGGGGGGVSRGNTKTLLPGVTYTIVIGSGGGASNNVYATYATTGVATTFYDGSSYLIQVNGGAGGYSPQYEDIYNAVGGGAGGTVTTGSNAKTGGAGGMGHYTAGGTNQDAPAGTSDGTGGGGGGGIGDDAYDSDRGGNGCSPGGTSGAGGAAGISHVTWNVLPATVGQNGNGGATGGGIDGTYPTICGGGGGGGGGALIGTSYVGGGGGGGGSTFGTYTPGGTGGPGRMAITFTEV